MSASSSKPAHLPTDPEYPDAKDEKTAATRLAPTSDVRELHERLQADPRFNPPPPSAWKRIALLALIGFLLYLAFSMRTRTARKEQVVYANRCVSFLLMCG